MASVTLYTKPQCVQCEQTKKYLNLKDVPFSTVDITEDNEALEMVLGLGFKSAPVVIVTGDSLDDSWSGFRLDKLAKLSETLGN